MKIGTVVFSKRGRDKGRPFVVVSEESEYIYLVDGDVRPLEKPKKKKVKHVQPTNTVFDLQSVGKRGLNDSDFRKWLEPFRRRS